MEIGLLDDIHDERFKNEDETPQFEEYHDVNPQVYTNFVDIPEYHDYYEEFPTVYYENVYDDPREKEERRERDSSSSSANSGATAGVAGAAALGVGGIISSTGRRSGRSESSTGGRSGRGSVTGSSSSALSRISASQIIATTFIALVAVAGFVLPAIDNAELSVDLSVDYGGETLSYTVSLGNYSANTNYYIVVTEGGTVVLEKQIFEGHQTGVLQGLDGTKDHKVEVRTGLVPLYVVDSAVIPGQDIIYVPVEVNSLKGVSNTIEYDVVAKVNSSPVSMGVYAAEGEEAVFTKVLDEGTNTGVVTDLEYNHEYVVKFFDEKQTHIIRAVTTERDIQEPSASPIDFTYGETESVIVIGLE